MQYIRPKVSTLVIGQAASMGSLAADGGGKGHAVQPAELSRHGSSTFGRLSGPGDGHHDPRPGNRKAEAPSERDLRASHTGNSYETVEAALERDNFMSAEDAKAWGLIDQILESRGKADDTSK